MSTQIWLYWLPVALAVGLGSALLGRARGWGIGVMGALYWVTFSLSAVENTTRARPAAILPLALGAVALIWVSLWTTTAHRPRHRTTPKSSRANQPGHDTLDANGKLIEVLDRFDEWLIAHGDKLSPWPEFGEFVRSALYHTTGAQHLRAYRLPPGSDRLHPLWKTASKDNDSPSARAGIMGHVATSGKSYYEGDPSHGELVNELAAESDQRTAWCFAVKNHRRTIGLVHVRELETERAFDPTWITLLERVIALCWATFAETCVGRLASSTDPVSGVPTREAFMSSSNRSLRDSYDSGEPVALVNINIEGLRTLTDNQEWDLASEVLYEVSSVIKQRVRQDDQIGVFDGTSFLLLLRRVDSQLASLIVKQLMSRLASICGDRDRWGVTLTARCGVAGSGVSQPTLRNLTARATASCREARQQDVDVVSDLAEPVGAAQA